jgi:acetyl esterase
LDCARALQFLRANAKKWNLDPGLVASTGAPPAPGRRCGWRFMTIWRIVRATIRLPGSRRDFPGQSSYDPRFAEKIGIPRPNFERHPFFLPFYGITKEEIDTPKAYKLYEEAAPITYLTKDDPPALLNYSLPNEEVTEQTSLNHIVHHPKFGIALKQRMDNIGVECIVQYVGHPEGRRVEAVDFIRKHFELAKKKRTDRK